jgi:DNA-binding HxlR family transcriptional regulator
VADFRYSLFCPLARAAEVLGNRWSVLILRELMVGPQRFSDLKRRLGGVSPSVLTERLSAMEGLGLIAPDELPPPAASRVYRLTPRGESARPVLLELARFGLHWLGAREAGDHFEPDWLRVSLEAYAVPGPTPAYRYEIEVLTESARLRLRFGGGPEGFHFFDDAGDVDAAIRAAPESLLGLLIGALSPEQARRAGASIEGDAAALAALPGFFEFSPELPSSSRAQTPGQGANP